MTQSVKENVSGDLQTSPIYRIRGQKSRWRYPDPHLTPEDALYMRNMNLSEFGSADVRYGTVAYNATQLTGAEAVVGLIQEKFSTGSTHVFVITPTKIYHDDGTTKTNLTGALTLNGGNDARTRHALIRDQLVGTNGVNATWVKDNGGAVGVATALSGVSWSKCQDLVSHKGLLVALNLTEGGINYPTRLRWCDINTRTFVPDITVWRADSRYEVYEGGTAIIGAVDSWTKLLIFKEDGMYPGAIEYNVGFLEYRMQEPIMRGFHPLAKNSFLARPEFVWGIAKEGPFVIRPDMSFELVGQGVQDVWNTLSQSRLQYATSWIREKDHQVRTMLSSATVTSGHDLVLVWDWQTGDIFFDEPTATVNMAARAVIANEEIDLLGTINGYTYQGNLSSSADDNGTGINWAVRLQPNDLGFPGVTKQIVDVNTLYFSREEAGTISIIVTRDQGQLPQRSRTLALSSGLVYDGGYTYDSGLTYDGSQVRLASFFVNRTAEDISPEWVGNNPTSLLGYQVTYTVQEG